MEFSTDDQSTENIWFIPVSDDRRCHMPWLVAVLMNMRHVSAATDAPGGILVDVSSGMEEVVLQKVGAAWEKVDMWIELRDRKATCRKAYAEKLQKIASLERRLARADREYAWFVDSRVRSEDPSPIVLNFGEMRDGRKHWGSISVNLCSQIYKLEIWVRQIQDSIEDISLRMKYLCKAPPRRWWRRPWGC